MMSVSIEELVKNIGGVYKLVLVAARRASELNEGAPPLIQTESKKAATVALEEIRQGVVTYKQKGK